MGELKSISFVISYVDGQKTDEELNEYVDKYASNISKSLRV